MENNSINPNIIESIKKAQIDEETGTIIYGYMAKREKNAHNKEILEHMSQDEKKHADTWHEITNEDLHPNKMKIYWMKFLTVVMGFTFVVKTMQKEERLGQQTYEKMQKELPQAAEMLKEERQHEKNLYGMLDEERLHYVGAMVLGLNDALVELTGAIAGVTFALADNRLIALTGIVTGISATLSMAASNYLAVRADGSEDALKSSLYTGVAYLVTVVFLVLPFLVYPIHMYLEAFISMIVIVLLIILVFNYYISVTKEEKFTSRFVEMAAISLSVAVLSFVIGILAKNMLGIGV